LNIQILSYILLTGLAFGSSLIASRFGIRQIDPYLYTGLRMGMASLGFLSVYLLDRRRRRWPSNLRLWGYSLFLGFFGAAIPMTTTLLSLRYISSGIAAVLLTTGPAMTVLMAHFFLADETLTWRKSLGVVLALSGALMLAIRGESGLAEAGQSSLLGYGLIFVVLLCVSSTTIYARKFLRGFDAFDVTSTQIFIATLIVLPLSALFIGIDLQNVNIQGYFSLVYSALVGTFIGFILYFYTIKQFGATQAAMTNYVVPVAASLGGVLLLDEKITVGMLIGMGIIILGILLINYRGPIYTRLNKELETP
jgi:drug/metabolite transporter (DMT)-like permease